jgi:Mrp family chromosome partitioning ATPase
MVYPVSLVGSPQDKKYGELIPQALHSVSIDLACSLPPSELAKLYRTIEAALPDMPNRAVQFVSAYESEGADAIAFEMAIIAARLIGKRVLFIDTSPASARVRQQETLTTNPVPLDTLLLTGRPPHEAIAQVAGTELYVAMLHAREDQDYPSASLTALEAAIDNLRPSFDLIVVDSPAILTDAFSMALAKLVDGSILVVEAERTRAPVALECKRLIDSAGGRIIGSILNRRRYYIPKFLYRLLYPQTSV